MTKSRGSELIITAVFEARPGEETTGEADLVRLAERSRREAGCLAYEVYCVSGRPGEFVLFERWVDEDAWRTHLATPHVSALRSELFTTVPPGTRLKHASMTDTSTSEEDTQ